MKFSDRTTTFFVIAIMITIIASGSYAYFFIVMKNKMTATAELFLKIEQISESDASRGQLSFAIKNERENIDKLSASFIKESEVVVFAKKIEDLGVQSKTNLVISSLEPGVIEKTVPVLNFSIKATGTFENITHLILLLENFPAKFEWRIVRITRSDDPVTTDDDKVKTIGLPDWQAEVSLTALNFVRE